MILSIFYRFVLFILLVVCCFLIEKTEQQHSDVIGCGGFIKSETDINYKVVRVQLITKDGIPIYTTEAAPNNGYYMIPVYERGEYVLKLLPPPGWSFEPSQMELTIDGENDPCTLNHDLNFVFKGFGLAGRVISAGSTTATSGGPAGVTLSLYQNNKKLNETKSKADGTFEFFDVLPGDYTVKGSHERWKFTQATSQVQLSKERWEIEQPIVVQGYTVKGTIVHQSAPLTAVDVLLFRTPTNGHSGQQPPTCEHNGPLTDEQIALLPPTVTPQSFVCRTRTNAKGEYIFDDVPVGLYIVLPLYTKPSLSIVFVPDQKAVTVAHKDFSIQVPFETATISFMGRVVQPTKTDKPLPLSNVKISIDGKPCCKSDANGRFKLSHVRPTGSVKVTGELDGYTFKEIIHPVNLNRLIGAGDSSTLVLSPEKIRVSGRVQCSSTRKQTIRYTDADKKTIVRLDVEPNSEYSVYVAPGVYTFSPELSETDVRSGLHLTPAEIEVDVSQGLPVDQINFSQLKAKLNGRIRCIDHCPEDLPTLELTSRAGVIIKIDSVKNPNRNDELLFEQDNLLPAKYTLSLLAPNNDDRHCWKQSRMDVDLSSANKTVTFEQTGLKLRINLQTSNKVTLKIAQRKEGGSVTSMDLSSGINELCLPARGVYELTPESCMKFENEKYFYDTSKSSSTTSIDLIPTEYQVFISIDSGRDDQTTVSFPVLIRNAKQDKDFTLNLKKDKTKWMGSFWARHGDQFILFPQSDTWLFEPDRASITVSSEHCQANQVHFIGRKGLFIRGQTRPPTLDANVSLYTVATGRETDQTFDIDGQSMILLLSASTNNAGSYEFGPLADNRPYHIVIHKSGHIFTRQSSSPYDFASEKLASIHVQIPDVDGVFLLLTSSSNTMRRRTATTDSRGEVIFDELTSGQYYLRPQLREYEFQPEDVQLEVKSGDDLTYKFEARRTAYSCFGQVTSLNNEPEFGLIVDAIGIDGCEGVSRESAKTDINGQFRLRGLQPGCRYRIQHRLNPSDSSQSDIVQVEPSDKYIDIANADVFFVHLYTIKRPSDIDLSVFIQTQPQFLNQLKIKLYKAMQRDSPLQTVTITNSPFAYLNSLPFDNESYVLRLESPLSTSVYTYVQPEIAFTANQTFLFFTLNFEPHLKIYDGEARLSGSYSAFIIAILIVALVFKQETILPLVQSAYAHVRQTLAPKFIKTLSSSLSSSSTSLSFQQAGSQTLKSSSSAASLSTATNSKTTVSTNGENVANPTDVKRRQRLID